MKNYSDDSIVSDQFYLDLRRETLDFVRTGVMTKRLGQFSETLIKHKHILSHDEVVDFILNRSRFYSVLKKIESICMDV